MSPRARWSQRLDPTRSESNVGESQAKYRASLAASIRLTAEVNNQPLIFPTIAEGLAGATGGRNSPLSQSQGAANEVYAATEQSLSLVNSELAINEKLAKTGAGQ